MTDEIAHLYVDVHLPDAKLNLLLLGNCFLIASTVSENSLQQMLIRVLASVANDSRLSLRVWVRVQPQPVPNWRCGLSIHAHCQLGYGSMLNSQSVWIGEVVSGPPSWSIHRFNYGSCFWSVLIVSYQNRVSNNQGCVFACFAACNINYFGISVLPLINCIFAYKGSQ